MAPTANSAGIPTLGGGLEPTPQPSWRDEPGTMRIVVGFGSDSNDRIVGTMKLAPRSRASDQAHQAVTAAATGGWLGLFDPVYSNADQVVASEEAIAVRVERIAWVISWADFQQGHGVADEASRS